MAGEVTTEEALEMGQNMIVEMAGAGGNTERPAAFSELFKDTDSVGKEEADAAIDKLSNIDADNELFKDTDSVGKEEAGAAISFLTWFGHLRL